MASHEQIWLSPNLEKRRWAAKFRSTYGVRGRAPGLQPPDVRLAENKNPKLEQRIVWIADAQRDDLEMAGGRLEIPRFIQRDAELVVGEHHVRLQRDGPSQRRDGLRDF